MATLTNSELTEKYPHLRFRKHWGLTDFAAILLGQCKAYVEAICHTPILPKHHEQLLVVALSKGAQATTAIEGNTLSDAEISRIMEGQRLPPSKEYQEIEVKNILEAFNELLSKVVDGGQIEMITPDFICHLHHLVGKDLGDHLQAIPGRLRQDNRVVGPYRCPQPEDVEILIEKFCDWIKEEFHFQKGQSFEDVVLQAIISHVYLEWIHPFGDGNGRTGRLLEFYILLRGGLPDIASHILSNHYNNTRPEYYRHLQYANIKRDLSEFIQYALLGFRDGLKQTLEVIQQSQLEITWQKYIYDRFAEKPINKRDAFKRLREFMLNIPIDRPLSFQELTEVWVKSAIKFGNYSKKTLTRDIDELRKMELIQYKEGEFFAAVNKVRGSQARHRHTGWN